MEYDIAPKIPPHFILKSICIYISLNATTNHTYFVRYMYIILLHIFTLFCTKGMVGRSNPSSSASLDPCSRNMYLFVAIRQTIPCASLCQGTVLGLPLPINPYHFYTIIIYKIHRLRPDIPAQLMNQLINGVYTSSIILAAWSNVFFCLFFFFDPLNNKLMYLQPRHTYNNQPHC